MIELSNWFTMWLVKIKGQWRIKFNGCYSEVKGDGIISHHGKPYGPKRWLLQHIIIAWVAEVCDIPPCDLDQIQVWLTINSEFTANVIHCITLGSQRLWTVTRVRSTWLRHSCVRHESQAYGRYHFPFIHMPMLCFTWSRGFMNIAIVSLSHTSLVEIGGLCTYLTFLLFRDNVRVFSKLVRSSGLIRFSCQSPRVHSRI